MTTTEHPDVVEGEIVDGITGQKPPVPPRPQPPGGKSGVPKADPRPIVPPWMKDRSEVRAKVKDVRKRAGHTVAWHLVPWHLVPNAARVLKYALFGLWRIVRKVGGWTMHAEVRPMQRAHSMAKGGAGAADWHKLEQERKAAVHRRWLGMAWTTLLGLITVALWWWLMPRWTLASHGWGIPLADQTPWWVLPDWMLTPWWTFVLIVLGAVWPLARYGRPADQQLVNRATAVDGKPPIRLPLIYAALVSLRIAGMNEKTAESIRPLCDLARDSSGYRADLYLPPGVPASAVAAKRSELSASLQRELGCVWPEVGKDHEGHLILYISDQNMSTTEQERWPVLRKNQSNVFEPAPAFTNQRTRWVPLTLAYTSGVIGGNPRMGKSFFVRELGLLAGMDVRTKVAAIDLKGTGDLSPLALFAHFYSRGYRPDKIEEQLEFVRWLSNDMQRRADVIDGLSHEECPESKVTDELASRKSLGLEPWLVLVDECQQWFNHPDKKIAAEFQRLCTDLVTQGPALGIMCYFSTQKPSAKAIPTSVSDNAVIRVCFRVIGYESNDAVLGDGMHKAGITAELFSFDDKGIAYLLGEGDKPQIVRTVDGLDAPASEKIAEEIRKSRVRAGRLTGHAAGEEMEREEEQLKLLDDVRQVFGTADVMDIGSIATGLARLRPELHGGLDSKTLPPQLRRMEVKVEKIHVPALGKSALAVRREWLDVSTTRLIGDEETGEETGGDVISLTERR